MSDREPQPSDGPDYHAEHAAWLGRQPKPSWRQRAERAEATIARVRAARAVMGGQAGHCEWGCTYDIDDALDGGA